MKDTNIKTRRKKNSELVSKLAEKFNCSERAVNYALTGGRGNRRVTQLCESICIAAGIYDQAVDQAFQNIDKAFPNPKTHSPA